MPKSKHARLAEKEISAALASIEIYNKPDFRYREESFSILIINAWELLLKARIVLENNGDQKSIEVWDYFTTKSGTRSRRKRPVKTRSGNVRTIGIDKAIGLVQSYATNNINERCITNLKLLIEIRDTSVHFMNGDIGLSARVLEVGMGAVQNFAQALSEWFQISLHDKNMYLMPLAFQSPTAIFESLETHPRT